MKEYKIKKAKKQKKFLLNYLAFPFAFLFAFLYLDLVIWNL
jgi:hypothetical protein